MFKYFYLNPWEKYTENPTLQQLSRTTRGKNIVNLFWLFTELWRGLVQSFPLFLPTKDVVKFQKWVPHPGQWEITFGNPGQIYVNFDYISEIPSLNHILPFEQILRTVFSKVLFYSKVLF